MLRLKSKMSSIAINVNQLTKRFGKYTAVDNVSFSLSYGEIFGFLGANGAGKSTTIRMLCGILLPTSGTATVAGFDVQSESEKIKQSIGYVSQKFSLYTDLTVMENLQFYANIYSLTSDHIDERIDEVLTLTGLTEWKNRLAAELSGGWRQKLALANAIVHKPKILFLDEPTAGIDPLSRRSLWEMLYQLADSGVALFVTTHYMEEAERCNQIAFISQGKLLRVGSPQQLKNDVSGNLLEVECRPLMKASRLFQTIDGVLGITAYGTTLHLNVTHVDDVRLQIESIARKEGIEVISIKPIKASLEDVFSALTEEVHEKY